MTRLSVSRCLAALAVAVVPFLLNSAYGDANIPIAEKTPVREVNIKGRYSMMVPEYLTKSAPNELNSEASLEYQNLTKEVYVIVIDEAKQDFKDIFIELGDYDTSKTVLENYARAQVESISANLKSITKKSPVRPLKTGCGNALVYDMSGFEVGIEEEMAFTLGFIEGKLNVYMIMTWTYKTSIAQYQADMDAMIVSFKELSGAIDDGIDENYTVSRRGLYSMTVIGSMAEDTSLNDEASLEYADYTRELYVMVIDEPVADFIENYKQDKLYDDNKSPLDNYATIQREAFANNMKSINELSDVSTGKVNGLPCRKFLMRGYVEGIEEQILYKFCLVQGKNNFYVVMSWTLATSRDKNEPDMDLMLNSFKEL